jgi:hypothetical protein
MSQPNDSRPAANYEGTPKDIPVVWQRHKDTILTVGVIVLFLKNRRLKRSHVELILKNRELMATNRALINIVQSAPVQAVRERLVS